MRIGYVLECDCSHILLPYSYAWNIDLFHKTYNVVRCRIGTQSRNWCRSNYFLVSSVYHLRSFFFLPEVTVLSLAIIFFKCTELFLNMLTYSL